MGFAKEAELSDLLATSFVSPDASQANQEQIESNVNLVTGAFLLSEHDIRIPSRRLVIDLTRHYNNQRHDLSNPPGPFGRGWTHSFDLSVSSCEDRNGYEYFDDTGVRVRLESDGDSRRHLPVSGARGLELTVEDCGYLLRQADGLRAEFDSGGKPIALVRPGPTEDSRLDIEYDDDARIAMVRGTGGELIRFKYEEERNLVSEVVDHQGRSWGYEYDNDMQLVEVSFPTGHIRRYSYRKQKIAMLRGTLEEIRKSKEEAPVEKDKVDNVEIRGMHEVFRLSGRGDRTERELGVGYTSERRLHRLEDAHGGITRFDYNIFTRSTYVTGPDGQTTVYCYSRAGNITKIRTADGRTTEYVYDDRQNLIAVLGPEGEKLIFVELADPSVLDIHREFGRRVMGNRSDYLTVGQENIINGYDYRGNRPLSILPNGVTYRYLEYDDFGQPGEIALPRGGKIACEHEAGSGRPVRLLVTLLDDNGNKRELSREWEYDDVGNPLHMCESGEAIGGTPGELISVCPLRRNLDSPVCKEAFEHLVLYQVKGRIASHNQFGRGNRSICHTGGSEA